MKVTTLRLPESMYAALETEAEEREKSVSEYIRDILRERENTQENTQPNTSTEYADRLEELEERVATLEEIEGESNRNESERIGVSEPETTRVDSSSHESVREPARSRESTHELAADDETPRVYRDALEGWSPGQGGTDSENRREIGVTALQWLENQQGGKQKAEFVSALYDRTALEGQGEKSWWERVVRPALSTAAENGFVDDSGRSYRFVGK